VESLAVSVIGVGHLGQHHARIYAELPDVELKAVVDTDKARGEEIASARGCAALTDYRDLADVKAVSVVTPTTSHHEIAKYFLERGIAVLVEKPIALKPDEARDLIETAVASGAVLQVGHIERFNRAVQDLRAIIKQPRFIEAHRLGPYKPRVKDVGVVQDLMIHDIDLILELVGSPIERVEAVGVNVLSPSEDIANARLHFANGCIANVTASRITPEPMRKIRIFQSDAYFSLDYAKQQVEYYHKKGLGIQHDVLPTEKGEPLRDELIDFVDCVRTGRPPEVPGEAGLRALELTIAILDDIAARNPVLR